MNDTDFLGSNSSFATQVLLDSNFTTTTGTITTTGIYYVSSHSEVGGTSFAFVTDVDTVRTDDSLEDLTVGVLAGALIELIAFLPCTIGNLLTFFAFIKHRKLRKNLSNLYIMSLTLADLLVGVLLIPFETVLHFQQISQTVSLDNKTFCMIHRFVVIFVVGSSLAAMLMISLDRYIAVIYPFFYTEKVTARVAKLSIAITWTFMFALSMPVFTSLSLKPNDPEGLCEFPSPSHLRLRGKVYIVFLYAILLIIFLGNVALYMWVARTALKQQAKILDETSLPHGRTQKGRQSRNTKAMIGMFAVFILLWLPYMTVLSVHIGDFCPKAIKKCSSALQVTFALGIFNSGVNCYIYAWQKKDFKSVISLAMRRDDRVAPLQPHTRKLKNLNGSKGTVLSGSTKPSTRLEELRQVPTCHSSWALFERDSTRGVTLQEHQQAV
ncbi:histamine H2 receptor-like [Watersipora subatra]|uniref:histamine H2 receptor-like n=1 Tax=Watersipora subatra TaxID=2589382 RepID=UPI00355C624C